MLCFLLIYLAALLGNLLIITLTTRIIASTRQCTSSWKTILSGCWPHFHPCPQIHHELSDQWQHHFILWMCFTSVFLFPFSHYRSSATHSHVLWPLYYHLPPTQVWHYHEPWSLCADGCLFMAQWKSQCNSHTQLLPFLHRMRGSPEVHQFFCDVPQLLSGLFI